MHRSLSVLTTIVEDCGMSVELVTRGAERKKETNLETFAERKQAVLSLVSEIVQLLNQKDLELGRLDQKRAVQLSVEIQHKNRRVEELYCDLRHFYEHYAAECLHAGKGDELAALRVEFRALEESIRTMRTRLRSFKRVAQESVRVLGLADVEATSLPASNDERIRTLEQNDAELDEKMDVLIANTLEVKDLAVNITNKSQEQDVKVALLAESLDRQNTRERSRNTTLQRRLSNVRGPDKMCFTVMLIFVVLGVVVFFSMAWLK